MLKHIFTTKIILMIVYNIFQLTVAFWNNVNGCLMLHNVFWTLPWKSTNIRSRIKADIYRRNNRWFVQFYAKQHKLNLYRYVYFIWFGFSLKASKSQNLRKTKMTIWSNKQSYILLPIWILYQAKKMFYTG